MNSTSEMTTGAFIDALAAQQPTPGGGGAAALTGSQAAALVSMVINFTVGKKKYIAVEEEMKTYLEQSEQLRHELLALADSDVAAFSAVAATYSMPKESDAEKAARTAAMQEALKNAAKVPMAVAEKCLQVMKLSVPVGSKGNVNVVSDAACALYLAQSALLCAIVNVNINLKSISDVDFNQAYGAKVADVLQQATSTYTEGQSAIAVALGVVL
ncbi:MAG: cyclodeaminase/cyclohydrolase family protein [Caldilineaceae bacterium]